MLPNSRLFRSRWSALLWAAGMVWLAIDVAGTGGGARHSGGRGATTDATGISVEDSDTRNALNAFDSIN